MPRRFDQFYRVKARDNLGDPDYWNRRFEDIDRRVSSNEDGLDAIGGLTAYVEGLALNRLDLVLAPALDKIALVSEQGFLLAHSFSTVTLDTNTTQVFSIPDQAERELFAPSPFVTIVREANQTDYAFARTVDFDHVSGQLTVQPVQIFGNPGPHSDWIIYVGSAVSKAVEQMLNDTKAARDTALQYKGDAATSAAQAAADRASIAQAKTDTLAARDAAAQSALNAQTWDPTNYATKAVNNATFVSYLIAQNLGVAPRDLARKNLGIFWQQAVPAATDWNTLTDEGTYYSSQPTIAGKNAPGTVGTFWYLQVQAYGQDLENYVMQRAVQLDTNSTVNAYCRVLAAGTWGAWKPVLTGDSIATVANMKSGTGSGVINVANAYSAAAFYPVGSVGAGTLTIDMNNGSRQFITLAGNITVAAPLNPKDGQVLELLFAQDATGNRTVSWAALWRFPDGVAPAVYAGANNASLIVSATYSIAAGQWMAAAWKPY
ncbi:pyocin knob domain-containing protein [Bradyrhizobium sp. th.b2]|uniref:pyocin knob domain-containing protein n=1 Tax=Bradyrhizobium sp. th-b2 TaxID=172088 RepID=UPI000428BCFB|nr:pyocin knob domain-containing protein [Bradyrhizobium sp. th.b2]